MNYAVKILNNGYGNDYVSKAKKHTFMRFPAPHTLKVDGETFL